MKRTFSSSTLLLAVTILSLAAFLPALQSGVGGGGQSNVGGGGAVTFPLLAPAGSAAAPSYSLSANPGTGIFSVGGGAGLGFSAGGTLVYSYSSTGFNVNNGVIFQAPLYSTFSNCSSSASPAVCVSAAAGSVVIAAAATTVQVNTTAVTANSQIFIQEDDSLGARLSVTCNTTSLGATKISARSAGASFTVTTATAPTTNPACLSYWIMN